MPGPTDMPAPDPFLTRLDDTNSETKPLRGPRKRDPVKDAFMAVALPWLIAALLLFSFLFAYQELAVLVWAVIVVCVCLSLLFLILGRSVNNVTFITIGALSLVSILLASSVGLWLNDAFLESYSWIGSTAELKDVDPTSAAASVEGKTAVGIFHFTSGAFVDNFRTLGFVAEGEIFCVAPVALAGAPNASVSYWAAGQNCCGKRTNFDCGAARNADLSAVEGVATEHAYAWNQKSELVHFSKAIAQAEAVYGLNSTKDARLLSFVKSYREVTDDLWDQALQAACYSCIGFFVICFVGGVLLIRVLAVSTQETAASLVTL